MTRFEARCDFLDRHEGLSVNALSGGGTAVLAPPDSAFTAGLALPLIWRRRHPADVFAVICAVALAQWLYTERVLGGFAIVLALYSVARHAPRRATLPAAVTAEAAGAVAVTVNGRNWLQFLAVLTAVIAEPVFLGSYLGTRQAYLSALEERARRLEREHDQQAQIAAAAERADIAREVHDTVACSLAVIITMAEAASARHRSDPERRLAAMEQVAETGRKALDQTRRVLGVLGRPPSPPVPAARP